MVTPNASYTRVFQVREEEFPGRSTLTSILTPCEGIQIPETGKFFVGAGIQDNFSCVIRNRGLWNPEYLLINPESH